MNNSQEQERAELQVDGFRQALGPFVVAAEASRMPMVFTNAREAGHHIVFANDSVLRLIGYGRDEVIGQPFDFLMSEIADPASLERIRSQFDDGTETLDIECRRKDGGRVWLGLCVDSVRDQNGELAQHCASFVDLSAQMRRMRRERDALHVIYEHTPDFIALTEGPDHRFTFANAAYYRLVGPKDLIGLSVAEAFPELASQQIFGHLDQVYETGEPFRGASMPVKLQREFGADLELRFLDFICQPVRGGDGSITGMFWEGHDVTDQKAGAEQVQALQSKLVHLARVSAMGTMAATLAHELTQPLTVISNYAAACGVRNRADGDNVDAIADDLTAIGESARFAGEIIRRLKDMTMRRRSRREIFDLKQAVQESVVLVRAGTGGSISIEDCSSGTVQLQADRIQIQQVMMNLIRNACEAVAGSAGRVRVSTAVKGDNVVISVADTGKGVSADASKTLFTWSESSKPNGMGMGLSVCRTIVEAHGGELRLERSGSEGSCFSLSLPIHAGLAHENDTPARLLAKPSRNRRLQPTLSESVC